MPQLEKLPKTYVKYSLKNNSPSEEINRSYQVEESEASIEDALTEAGFNWTQIKLLLIFGYVEIVMCADLEAITFLGSLLLR